MLNVEKIQGRFGSFVLKDITFHVPKGYIMGVIGPNGAGKTTIINRILGVTRGEEDRIYIDQLLSSENEKAVKEKVGFVLEKNCFPANLTIQKNVEMFARYYREFNQVMFDEYCEEFELNKKVKLYTMSKGEIMKFQLAFALAHNTAYSKYPQGVVVETPSVEDVMYYMVKGEKERGRGK